LKAAWELIEIFYVDKQSQAWLPERLVDWLAVRIYFYFLDGFCKWLHFILMLIAILILVYYCILWQDYDSLFTSAHETIHGKLVDFQKELVNIQVWS